MSSTPTAASSETPSAAPGSEYRFHKEGELSFLSADGKTVISKIDIEIASSDQERARGLMKRQNIDENTGMLFIFDEPDMQSFWMHDTPTSLDIMFISPDRKILNIHEFTKPLSDQPTYPSTGPANLVVEVVAGYSKKHGVKAGDMIDYKISE